MLGKRNRDLTDFSWNQNRVLTKVDSKKESDDDSPVTLGSSQNPLMDESCGKPYSKA
jgi:hypothetical protein